MSVNHAGAPASIHTDLLERLNDLSSITEKVEYLHGIIKRRYSFVDRISIVIYDADTDMLKTLAHSTENGNSLPLYQAKLKDVTSLQAIVQAHTPRVINDLSIFDDSEHEHAKRIREHGLQASYTVPIFHDKEFVGFTFFNSRSRDIFEEENLSYLDMTSHLIAFLVNTEIKGIETMHGALRTAVQFTHHRDSETGAHLQRMAHFVRIISREVARKASLCDEYVENMFWFAPLHDVGKIAIPDAILLKRGTLTKREFEVMKTHSTLGGEIIDNIIKNFDFGHVKGMRQLHNIVMYHHENIDGSGYPEGLKGDDIPLEARIVAVADVFDALTSVRPYKGSWDNEDAIAELRRLGSWKLDAELIEALIEHMEEVIEIQQLFQDEKS